MKKIITTVVFILFSFPLHATTAQSVIEKECSLLTVVDLAAIEKAIKEAKKMRLEFKNQFLNAETDRRQKKYLNLMDSSDKAIIDFRKERRELLLLWKQLCND